eukprot:CAMPEP_0119568162 /NCGR_PEP_ID=MMETSP1352-20130426/38072_1 /TAXON_ID=265584 /ORGANISM="Stauroneis constricta, Strain CCMP1120" /LENGTH=200 /DNA_ID=CAMNT_0007617513 /DNA_START=23 /DNA_END=622 /DNA_ORIENTATION=-
MQYFLLVSEDPSAAATQNRGNGIADAEEQETVDFQLRVQQTVSNDICQTSTQMDLEKGSGIVIGSDQAASQDSLPACLALRGRDSEGNVPSSAWSDFDGLWYEVQGTGSLMHASVSCPSAESSSSHSTSVIVNVLTGECDQLQCLNEINDGENLIVAGENQDEDDNEDEDKPAGQFVVISTCNSQHTDATDSNSYDIAWS